jgi:hypothetical protein
MSEALDSAELVQFVLGSIAEGELDLHLERMAAVVHARRKVLWAQAEASAMARIKVGDRVRCRESESGRRSKWDGRKGLVTGRKGDRLILELEPHGVLYVLPSMVEVIS